MCPPSVCNPGPVHIGIKNKRKSHFAEIVSIQECLCSEPTDFSTHIHMYHTAN